MFKSILFLIVLSGTLLADTITVNLGDSDFRSVDLHGDHGELITVINLEGYGVLNLHRDDLIIPRMTMGIFSGPSISLDLCTSMKIFYSKTEENWTDAHRPDNCIDLDSISFIIDEKEVGLYDKFESQTGEAGRRMLPLFEDWSWTNVDPQIEYGVDYFKNWEEVFYIENENGNNLKFQFLGDVDEYSLRLVIASDSLKNNVFPTDAMPINGKGYKNKTKNLITFTNVGDQITFSKNLNSGEVKFFSLSGKLVRNEKISGNKLKLKNFASGMYLYKISEGANLLSKGVFRIN